MKKLVISLFFVLVFGTAMVVSSTPEAMPAVQTSTAVELPKEVSEAIGIGFVALMTLGLNYLFQITKLDLRGFAIPLASAISLFVVGELQNIINTIPEMYDPWLNMGFKILVILLGSIGVLFAIRGPSWHGASLIPSDD